MWNWVSPKHNMVSLYATMKSGLLLNYTTVENGTFSWGSSCCRRCSSIEWASSSSRSFFLSFMEASRACDAYKLDSDPTFYVQGNWSSSVLSCDVFWTSQNPTCAWTGFRPLVMMVWCVTTTQSVSRSIRSWNCAWLCRLDSTSPTLSNNSWVTCRVNRVLRFIHITMFQLENCLKLISSPGVFKLKLSQQRF